MNLQQPTNNELAAALAEAQRLLCDFRPTPGTPGYRALEALIELRTQRVSWFGVEAQQIRREVDAFLQSPGMVS